MALTATHFKKKRCYSIALVKYVGQFFETSRKIIRKPIVNIIATLIPRCSIKIKNRNISRIINRIANSKS